MISNNKTIKNFWIVLFASLAVLAIATAIYVGISLNNKIYSLRATTINDENYYKRELENTYERNLYSIVDGLQNIECNLAKLSVTNNDSNAKAYLVKVVGESCAVSEELNNLPSGISENILKTEKFVNQLNDYALYLCKKDSVTVADKVNLRAMQTTAGRLCAQMRTFVTEDTAMFMTNSMRLDGSNGFSDSINDIKENMFDYPQLIYDGPFSDNTKNVTIDNKTTMPIKDIETKLKGYFADYNVKSVKAEGVVSNKATVNMFNVSTEIGEFTVFCSLDGRVAEINGYTTGTKYNKTKEECIDICEKFATKLGYDVKGVWVSRSGEDVTYVNLAPIVNGTIMYTDLVEMSVDRSSGMVISVNSYAYLSNHKDRKVTALQTEKDARAKVNADIVVKESNLALIKKGEKEVLCYEFCGESNGEQYFIYISAEDLT
ncbi:MAG: germination protein YpeB, partial [Clostridia bacterium]